MGEFDDTNLSQYFYFNKLMKIGEYKYKYYGRTASVRGRGVLVRLAEGKC
jgi:hypothetical protein